MVVLDGHGVVVMDGYGVVVMDGHAPAVMGGRWSLVSVEQNPGGKGPLLTAFEGALLLA